MRTPYLFVYGTLRSGFSHSMHRYLRRYAVYIGKAYARGNLYEIDGYPGLVLSASPRDVVCGELYRIRNAPMLFKRLDRYEECDNTFPQPHEYRREIIRVTYRKRLLKAWVYLYNLPTVKKRRIKSGDYLLKNAATPPCALQVRLS
jgi:gamma-glutamylcyclotransferase (GGCT)/AIG2-like uncharacterized protein YtfP